ncbi:MAG: hypothetical protein DMG88_09445 [Acidobacteria bacterium]|nr:MAG: hypothetical protein DMG88_09445 [Acidobacteriota bacterium]
MTVPRMTVSKLPQANAESIEAGNIAHSRQWINWLPLVLLLASAFGVRNVLPTWGFMWILALGIFMGLKWVTWWRGRTHPAWRSAAYLFAWPGMDAESFLDSSKRIPPVPLVAWFWAILETALGAISLWIVARALPASTPLLRGWVGMLGLILLLHFGIFQVLALTWQSFGIAATPIMSAPLRSHSLSEFWGKRWNLGFRQLSHDLIFRPLHRSLGPAEQDFWYLLRPD